MEEFQPLGRVCGAAWATLPARVVLLSLLWPVLPWSNPGPLAAQELAFNLGWYEVGRDEEAVEAAFDLTFDRELLWGIRPQTGALVTSDGTLYGWAGFRWTAPLPWEAWRLDLDTNVGLFEAGDGKDLGGVVEFRSGVDLMRRLGNGAWIGVGFHHISNAGIYDRNPGSNTLSIRFVAPSRSDHR